ncbi:DNA/RNA non-specific endonuclease [Mollicutes bacterium LVI A0078]|nr:DNA/RNA non-specific endonuclease [Mollicutes bacterium LVI A0075]WOO91455.1 DNA/RNA non-specific endonuclease [Mollicutes bacterium LVI A0078]
MNKTNGSNKNTGYKGKYYDPNYKRNKEKYGDLYDPKDFAVPNPNYEARKRDTSQNYKGRNTNYKGRRYNPNYNNSEWQRKKGKQGKTFFTLTVAFAVLMYLSVTTTMFDSVYDSLGITMPSPNNVSVSNTNTSTETPTDSVVTPDIENLLSNKEISVDSCDLSGNRQANVKVNIGYGSREYYGYTNEYGQLAYVQADSLQLQNSSTENLTSDGRYCDSQANVDGASGSYNRGHAIGDALGGDSNAYNIFPQLTDINSGTYNDIEMQLQDTLYNGGSVTNFELKLTYPNSLTNIPSSYTMSYNINGQYDEHTFNNK